MSQCQLHFLENLTSLKSSAHNKSITPVAVTANMSGVNCHFVMLYNIKNPLSRGLIENILLCYFHAWCVIIAPVTASKRYPVPIFKTCNTESPTRVAETIVHAKDCVTVILKFLNQRIPPIWEAFKIACLNFVSDFVNCFHNSKYLMLVTDTNLQVNQVFSKYFHMLYNMSSCHYQLVTPCQNDSYNKFTPA